MFLKRKINRILSDNQKGICISQNRSPLETMKELINFFSWVEFFSKNRYDNQIEKDYSRNKVFIKASFESKERLLPLLQNVSLKNLRCTSFSSDILTEYISHWEMDCDSYEKIYNTTRSSINYEKLSSYLRNTFAKSCNEIFKNPDDEVFQLLLIQNDPTLRNIINTLKKSIVETSTFSDDLILLHLEILRNFTNEIEKRVETLKTEENHRNNLLTKKMEEEMLNEIAYQRKILGLPNSIIR